MRATRERAGQRAPQLLVRTRGWRSGKMGCFLLRRRMKLLVVVPDEVAVLATQFR